MKKKYKLFIKRTIVMVVILILGIYAGMDYENDIQSKLLKNLSNSTKIAIVNLDSGVRYQDEQHNFAKELLENCTTDYVITGIEDAKQGIEDGRYGAYMILPTDFSKNVVSINQTPNKSLIKYEISDQLSKEAHDKSWQDVMQLKDKFNDDLGYIYISSILSEFHHGQDNAKKVLSNDLKDKEVLMAISNIDLITTLDIKEVERLQNNIEDLNIHPDVETNKKIIQTIDQAYKGYLATTTSELEDIKQETNFINEDVKNLELGVENIESIFTKEDIDNYHLDNLSDLINQKNNEITTHNELIDKNIATITNQLITGDKNLESQKENIIKNIQKLLDGMEGDLASLKGDKTSLIGKTYQEEFAHFIIAIQSINNDLLQGINNYYLQSSIHDTMTLEKYLNDIYQEHVDLHQYLDTYATFVGVQNNHSFTLNDYIQQFSLLNSYQDNSTLNQKLYSLLENKIEHNKQNIIETNTLDSMFQNYFKQLDKIKHLVEKLGNIHQKEIDSLLQEIDDPIPCILLSTVNQTIHQDLTDLNNRILDEKNLAQEKIQNHQLYLSQLLEKLSLYDPISNINHQQIEEYIKEFEENNSQLYQKIMDKNKEYQKYVEEVYLSTNRYIDQLKTQVVELQEASNQKLISGLNKAKQVREETSTLNNELLNQYIDQLNYTRNGSMVNHLVCDYIIDPTSIESVISKSKEVAKKGKVLKINQNILLSCICAVLVLCIGGEVKKKIKSKNNCKE